jgi:hypothetical protein
MTMPGFTAEASIYQFTRCYLMGPSITSIIADGLVSTAMMCSPGPYGWLCFDGGGGGGDGNGFGGPAGGDRFQCNDDCLNSCVSNCLLNSPERPLRGGERICASRPNAEIRVKRDIVYLCSTLRCFNLHSVAFVAVYYKRNRCLRAQF